MFSLEKFYKIIYLNLLEPINMGFVYFDKFGSTSINDLSGYSNNFAKKPNIYVIFYDQEPIYLKDACKIWGSETNCLSNFNHMYQSGSPDYFNLALTIIANSEISDEKNILFKYDDTNVNWYYFFHGFAALDWYNDVRYFPRVRNYSRVFMSFNHLYTKKRSYRLNLIAQLIEKNLTNHGYISLPSQNLRENVKAELFSKESLLSTESKKIIFKNIYSNPPELTIDTNNFNGELSAGADIDTLSLGLFHIVTETIFYDQKIHLTEKIFKPIVARRPFFLVAAPGNLAYLKSYGFKTFDRWIDESYDLEQDPDKRISLIVQEIERLCQLPPAELDKIYEEMWEVLDYNFEWFYNEFKLKIVDELVDNFHRCLCRHNAGVSKKSVYFIDYSKIDFKEVKQRLAQ